MNKKQIHKYNKELVTLVIVGSVDDGKSTLIGRLLYDTDQVYEDQLDVIKKSKKVEGELDFSLLTDGLIAEMEQKITIDVAYRYFSSSKRRFIAIDVPGHEQYTRNMVTGASKAEVAVLLIDARRGVLPQTKRHLTIATLLGIKNILVVINKMDLVNFEKKVFFKIKKEFELFAMKLNVFDLQFVATSSLKGDMIVERGKNMPWYTGDTVLGYLENIDINSSNSLVGFRFPVQYVVRPHQDLRIYTGMIDGGKVSVGDEIIVLPSGQKNKIKTIYLDNNKVKHAFYPQSVAIEFENEVDISRGDMIVKKNDLPCVGNELDVMICWMDVKDLQIGKTYLLKHTTRTLRCVIKDIIHRLNITDLNCEKVNNLKLNEIGKVQVMTYDKIVFDTYQDNKNTGSFILIDDMNFNTVGAGIIILEK